MQIGYVGTDLLANLPRGGCGARFAELDTSAERAIERLALHWIESLN